MILIDAFQTGLMTALPAFGSDRLTSYRFGFEWELKL